ncbi:MAG: acetate kinase [Lentisphaerota bacterium]
MNILVINAGSSSLKFTVFSFSWLGKQSVLASGQVECIGLPTSSLVYTKTGKAKVKTEIELSDERRLAKKYITHTDSLKVVCEKLLNKEDGVIANIHDILAIGHRVVHGGEKVTKPVIIDEHIKQVIIDCTSLAPLHNPANLAGILACEEAFPGVPNVAIFDTAFHQTMAPEAYLYAIPYELYEKHGFRRYGFHGTSHHYVGKTTAKFLKVAFEELKLITCHLGNGCSMAAINKGEVIDTSMGMTPLEGLVMGTRCGDLDPAIPLAIEHDLGIKASEVDTMLNKKSGLYGLAGIGTGDMRDVIQAGEKGNKQAETAKNVFIRRIVKYIGAYSAILGGADAVVFTGGIGENSAVVRAGVVSALGSLGTTLDSAANQACTSGSPAIISTKDSKMKAIVTPTNEELMIATQSVELLLEEGKLKVVTV